jgi:LysR family cys regulon transcriptional activator
MNLRQLQYLCEIVDHGLNVSVASHTLNRSQPGVSRYIKTLEQELGVRLFVRNGKRLVRLTRAGESILRVARRMLQDAETVVRIGHDFAAKDEGELIVATTHTHARYALPQTILSFVERYPKVRLSLRQGNPTEIAGWVAEGRADLSIAAMPLVPVTGLHFIPCYELRRTILAPTGHSLLQEKEITLESLVRYPMITYDESFTGRTQVARTFQQHGLTPRIAISATDADVMKVYVKLGLGLAIVGHIVFNPSEDVGIEGRDVGHLFQANMIYIGINSESYLRGYAYDFIQSFAPNITQKDIERGLAATRSPGP